MKEEEKREKLRRGQEKEEEWRALKIRREARSGVKAGVQGNTEDHYVLLRTSKRPFA